MPIPDYQSFMSPVLRLASTGEEQLTRNVVSRMAVDFAITEEEQAQLLPSGVSTVLGSRVGWAITYLKKACLLEATRKGHYKITARGVGLLAENPTVINTALLRRYAEFVLFQSPKNGKEEPSVVVPLDKEKNPQEAIDEAYAKIRGILASDLLQQVLSCTPTFFEQLVLDLLVRMGYGGSIRDASERVGGSGDGGIDGIIKEDRLGLDVVYVQAKRWQEDVGRPDIQQFVGALQGRRARKGVFITTSNFTKEAKEYAGSIESRLVLIDGDTLANFMMDYNVGVSTTQTYELKRVDSDYFVEALQ